MKLRNFLVPTVLSLSLLGAGCSSSADVNVGTGTTPSTPSTPSAPSGSGSPSATAPSDMPIYPGSTVTVSGGSGNIYLIAMTTDDTAAQVLTWYETAFVGEGFKGLGGLDLKASSRLYSSGNINMSLAVIDKSQPAANGKTVIKITRQEQAQQ